MCKYAHDDAHSYQIDDWPCVWQEWLMKPELEPFVLVMGAFAILAIAMSWMSGQTFYEIKADLGGTVLFLGGGLFAFILLRNSSFGSWLAESDDRKIQRYRIESIIKEGAVPAIDKVEAANAVIRELRAENDKKAILREHLFESAYSAARRLPRVRPERHPKDYSTEVEVAAIVYLKVYPRDIEVLRSSLKQVPRVILLSYAERFRATVTVFDEAWPRLRL